jgi:hypothetical protein
MQTPTIATIVDDINTVQDLFWRALGAFMVGYMFVWVYLHVG